GGDRPLRQPGGRQRRQRARRGLRDVRQPGGGGDRVTIGSLTPELNGTLAGIQGPVAVGSYNLDPVNLTIDDSGNTTVGDRRVAFTPRQGPTDYGDHISGLIPGGTIYYQLGHGSPVTVRGGAGNETFALESVSPDIALRIDGGGGVNTLDYSAYTRGVVVNLPLQTATDVLGGIANIRNVTGGAGNDILVGDARANVLRGGPGRDLLIGGLGADVLDGGADDDIVIGGWTDYDTNAAALDALLAAWAQPLPYNQRIENLMDIGVAYPGGTAFLNKDRVHDDLAADLLPGGLGRDWFFRDPLQTGLDSILDLVESGPDKERVTVTRN